MTYEYDDYHNVIKATTATGIVYEFVYDELGNNISVSIINGDSEITSTAEYSDDGNRLVSTTDALGNKTTYHYDEDTNVLVWVQYPEDTEVTQTNYSYDSMYRLASAEAAVDSGYTLYASYTYEDDLLTEITTNSTIYTFTYGIFSQASTIEIGNWKLASYTYTNDQDRYLNSLDYGNDDKVQYTYDAYGRVTQETFEDGDTVTYQYDNSGALATVTDSATGITTTYYYDLTDRLMKYVESGTGYNHSVGYEYDTLNNLTSLVETINGVKHSTSYTYDDDNRVDTVTHNQNGQNVINTDYTYDRHGRVEFINTWCHGYSSVSKDYCYNYIGFGKTSGQIINYQADTPQFVVNYDITYDDNGNITSVTVGTMYTTYAYDSANQLIREDNSKADKTWVWSYDNAGNILSKTEYAYTAGELGEAQDTVLYVYGDAEWGDLLTSYDGNSITYDGIGNPLSDGTWTYTWEHGRELVSMDDGDDHWIFAYDANGMRTKRTNGDTTYTYIYNGSQLVQMTVSGNTLNFIYDASGAPVVVIWNGTPYYYVTTLQGDIQLIIDLEGEILVSYDYDAWGNILEIEGTMADTLGVLNPLTYRGYVYDHDTGLYYLQSRYYHPTWGRFLNADSYTSTGQGILGNNMFAYCGNNPVNMIDSIGTACCYIYLSDDPFVGIFYSTGGGGGGGCYSAAFIYQYAKEARGEGTARVTTHSIDGGHSYGKVLPYEYSAFQIDESGVTILDAEVSLLRGDLEWENAKVTLFKFFSVDASAGITSDDGAYLGATASIVSTSAEISLGPLTFELSGYLGAIGAEVGINLDGFVFGFASGIGASIAVRWELN